MQWEWLRLMLTIWYFSAAQLLKTVHYFLTQNQIRIPPFHSVHPTDSDVGQLSDGDKIQIRTPSLPCRSVGDTNILQYAACASKKQFILDTLNTTLNNNFAATNKRKYILCIQYEKSISTETKSTHFTLVSFSYIYTEMRLNDDPPKWKIVNTAFIKKDTKKCKVTRYN